MTYTLIVVTPTYDTDGKEVSRKETDLCLELSFMAAHGAMAKYHEHCDFEGKTFIYVRRNQ